MKTAAVKCVNRMGLALASLLISKISTVLIIYMLLY